MELATSTSMAALRNQMLLVLTLIFPATFQVDASEPPAQSVYEVSAVKDGALIGATALGTLFANQYGDRHIDTRCPCNPSEVNALDRPVIGNANDFWESASDYTVAFAVVTPALLDWAALGNSPALIEDLTVYAEVLSVNAALTSVVKNTFQRPTPRAYGGDPNFLETHSGYRSFYSGHTSTTFAALAAASMTSRFRHHLYVWPWVITVGVGGGVAAQRIAAGRHFYTDVAVGALSGTLVGTLLPIFHRKDPKPGDQGFNLRPSSKGTGAMLAWTLHL